MMKRTDFNRRPTGDDGFAAPRQCLIQVGDLEYPGTTHVLPGFEVGPVGNEHGTIAVVDSDQILRNDVSCGGLRVDGFLLPYYTVERAGRKSTGPPKVFSGRLGDLKHKAFRRPRHRRLQNRVP